MSEKDIETKSKSKVAKGKPNAEITGTNVYCGPTLKNLQQFAIYQGDPPAHVKIHLESNAAINALFVPINELSKTKDNTSLPGKREYLLFQKAIEYAREVNR